MPDLWEAVKAAAGDGFSTILEKVRYTTPPAGDNIELLLSRCQLSQHLQPDTGVAAFVQQAEALIVAKCRFITEDIGLPHHESFLRKIGRRPTRLPRTKLFTTNYDLCFETAASRIGFVVVDGFSHALPQYFDGVHFGYDFVRREEGREIPDYIPNVFHLYKMHGSVDWERAATRIVRSRDPGRPLIIYPRDTKFESSYEQPFIETISRFQMSLRQRNTGLLVVGFGFNDLHLTEPIMAAVRSNVALRAVMVAPTLEKSTNAAIKTLSALITAGDTRLTMLEGRFEDVVPVLPTLVAATEQEQHSARLSGVVN